MSELLNVASLSEAPDLSSMTKAQLLEYAASVGVEGVSSSMTKASIRQAIEEATQ